MLAIARRSTVGSHDPVKRFVFASEPRQSDPDHHFLSPLFLTITTQPKLFPFPLKITHKAKLKVLNHHLSYARVLGFTFISFFFWLLLLINGEKHILAPTFYFYCFYFLFWKMFLILVSVVTSKMKKVDMANNRNK